MIGLSLLSAVWRVLKSHRLGLAATGGIAVAAATATLLDVFHPRGVGATDIAVYIVAIGSVILVNGVVGDRPLMLAEWPAPVARKPSG